MAAKIAFPFVGDSIGGSHISSLILIKNLDQNLFEPIIILHQKGPLSAYMDEKGISYVHLPIPRYAGSTPSPHKILIDASISAPTIRHFLKKSHIDLIHGNDLRINLTWSLARLGMNNKFIWHQRALPNTRSLLWHAVPWLSQKIIAISHAVEDSIKRGNGAKIVTIANPFEASESYSLASTPLPIKLELNLPNDALLLCFVGRVVKYKKPAFFIEIVHSVSRKLFRPVHGVIIGADQDGILNDLKKMTSQLKFNENIHFLGFRPSVNALMKGCDQLIAPCQIEAFGRTLIEAMLAELPIVAADAGGHREIIQDSDTGFLCPPDELGKFVDKIILLAEDDEFRQKIIQNAKKHAVKYYSLENHVNAVSCIYSRLLN